MLILRPSSAFSRVDLPTFGPADQRGDAAARPAAGAGRLPRLVPLLSHAPSPRRCPAAPAAARPLPAPPGAGSSPRRAPAARAPSTSQLATNHCSCGSPLTFSTAYAGSGRPRACRCSCSRVLGSFSSFAAGSSPSRPANSDSITAAGRRDPAVEVDRAEQRLERVGEDRAATEAAALQLTAAEPQLLAEPQPARDRGQRAAAHQRRPVAAQVALVGVRVLAKQQHRDGEVEHRVAEELEPLVVALAGAAVRERRVEQRRVAESVPEARLGPFAGGQQARLTAGW